jgi:hypothetical protein
LNKGYKQVSGLRINDHQMNPSETRKIINNGEKIFNTIKRINRKMAPNIIMDQIKDFIGLEVLTGKGKRCCLAKGQIVQYLFEFTDMLGSY